jgi:hypothetical protein
MRLGRGGGPGSHSASRSPSARAGHGPARACGSPTGRPRLWWAVAVATLGWLSIGGAADEQIPASTLLDVTALCPGRTRRATRLRLVRVFRQGWVALVVALLRQALWPEGRLVPEPWPAVPTWEDAGGEPPRALPEAA